MTLFLLSIAIVGTLLTYLLFRKATKGMSGWSFWTQLSVFLVAYGVFFGLIAVCIVGMFQSSWLISWAVTSIFTLFACRGVS